MSSGADVRLAELVGALSLATDIGMGQPFDQGCRTCLLAVRLAGEAGAPPANGGRVYYLALLRYAGCTADAGEAAALFGDELAAYAAFARLDPGRSGEVLGWLVRHAGAGRGAAGRLRRLAGALAEGSSGVRETYRGHCEVARRLAERLGPGSVLGRAIDHAFERWDGAGFPAGLAGEAIEPAARIVALARDVEVIARVAGPDAARAAVRARSGRAYEPALADLFLRRADALLGSLEEDASWAALMAAEPGPPRLLPEARMDDACRVMAQFADLKSRFTRGHSEGVSDLAEAAGWRADLPAERVTALRRAGLLHDLGRAGVPSGVWDRPGPLSDGGWERVRLHPYFTARILGRSSVLEPYATLAASHHERLDGSGYHRGCGPRDLDLPARILGAADAYSAMTEERPHRPGLAPEAAAAALERQAGEGRLDGDAVHLVLSAAGRPADPPRRPIPAGLTEREAEVLGLLARGLSNREMGARLGISPKTVGHHIAHIYGKIGVSTRPGATLFAVEHDLVARAATVRAGA